MNSSPEHVAGANAVRAMLYGAAAMAGPMISGAAMDLWMPHGLIRRWTLMWLIYLPLTWRRASAT